MEGTARPDWGPGHSATRSQGLAGLPIAQRVDDTNAHGATYDVAEGHRQQVCRQKGPKAHRGAERDAQGHHEHVGDRVLEAQGHKGGDGEPDGDRLAGRAAARIGHPHRRAHQPVAQDAPRERLRMRLSFQSRSPWQQVGIINSFKSSA